jgi:hypothetical protein
VSPLLPIFTKQKKPERGDDNREAGEWIDKMILVMTSVRKHSKVPAGGNPPKKDVRGEFACPICKKGMLQYSISSYNNHMAAKCTTEGCCAFME